MLSQANPDIYNYTPDDSLLVQFSGSKLADLTNLTGDELEPSIWLGEARYIAHQIFTTTIFGDGFTYDDANSHMNYDGSMTEVRNNRLFGLCHTPNTPAVSYTIYPFNGASGATIHPNNSLIWDTSAKRIAANNARWTDVTTENATVYKFYPMVKLFKGGAVAYFTITAYKPFPAGGFATYADFNTWWTTSSNKANFTLEQYDATAQAAYPNVYDVLMQFKVGAQQGQARNTQCSMFMPHNMKGVSEIYAAWDGSAFTEYYDENDPRFPHQKFAYGVTPTSAKVIAYYSSPYFFKGTVTAKYSSASDYNLVPYGYAWYSVSGIEGYRRFETIRTSDCDIRISFCTYPIDQLLDVATGLGFAATDQSGSVATNGNIDTNDHIWTPTYDDQGFVNGKTNVQEEKETYTEGGQNGEPINPWFNPYAGEDEEEYPDEDPSEDQKTPEIELPDVTLSSYGVFNRTYVLTKLLCQHLSDYLWNADATTFEDIIQDLRLVGDNVMNSIISVIMFPFEIPNDENSELIRIGRRTTPVYARPLITNNIVFDMGDCYCYAKFRNFLDYEPYTKAWLYIPFCGIFSVPLQQFMNKYIDIKISIDLLTGAGLAIIYADGLPIIYKNCKIGMQIPVTGADSTYTVRNYISAAQSFLSAAGAFAGGNYLSAVGSTISAATAFISADNPPLQSEGSSSPQCGMLAPNKCYFIIERPKSRLSNVPYYGKLIGFACYKSGLIAEFIGFSKFENVKLDISHCTDTERNEIIALLRSGVYL